MSKNTNSAAGQVDENIENVKDGPNFTDGELAKIYKKAQEYDVIIEDYNTLLLLSQESGLSIPELISSVKKTQHNARLAELKEQCNGNEELAQHIIDLETNTLDQPDDFAELKAYFPKFSEKNQLPESVTENARLRGTLLLDEYLRYLLKENLKTKAAIKEQELRDRASTGSQTNKKDEINPEAAEFLRGLWK